VSTPEERTGLRPEEIAEYGREWLLPGEAEELLRRRNIGFNIFMFILYLCVLYYFLRGLGIQISPQAIIMVIHGVAIKLPHYVKTMLPYVYHFYTFYMFISATVLLALSQRRAFLPEWVYPLDACIHMYCGYLCYLYTHDIGYLIIFFGLFGVVQLGLYLIFYRTMKREYIATALEGVKYGVRPRLTYAEARQLNIPEELIRQLGILPMGQEGKKKRKKGEEEEESEREVQKRRILESLLSALASIGLGRSMY